MIFFSYCNFFLIKKLEKEEYFIRKNQLIPQIGLMLLIIMVLHIFQFYQQVILYFSWPSIFLYIFPLFFPLIFFTNFRDTKSTLIFTNDMETFSERTIGKLKSLLIYNYSHLLNIFLRWIDWTMAIHIYYKSKRFCVAGWCIGNQEKY